MNTLQEIEKRTAWFRHDRFGMFIHWGLYAIPARGEWVRGQERFDAAEYHKFADEFNPVDFDPAAWAKAAKQAGMKYAVMTAKHHDGFCLFDSQYTDFKSTNTPCGRDLVKEYLDAFRAEGLRVGLYYSLLDWDHPDYPHASDANHPQRGNAAFSDENRNFSNYVAYLHHQVEELVSGKYGKLDIMWFDFSYGDLRGEAWEATKLVRMVRSYLPDIVLDNRLEASGSGFGSLASENPSEYSGDFASPEQIIPPAGLTNTLGKPIPWEACLTMNDHWGYATFDNHYKNAAVCVRKLVECVSKGGNMLLNVGPDARGRIPARSLEILSEIGAWMDHNGASIYGAGASFLPKHDYGRYTQNGKKLYVHVTEGTIGPVPIAGISRDQVARVRRLADGAQMPIASGWTTDNYPDYLFIGLGADPVSTYPLPDEIDTVIEITLK